MTVHKLKPGSPDLISPAQQALAWTIAMEAVVEGLPRVGANEEERHLALSSVAAEMSDRVRELVAEVARTSAA